MRNEPDSGATTPVVQLKAMSPEAFEAWRSRSILGYAQDKVRVGAWPADGAEARADHEFARLLPGGQATPGHGVRQIVDQTDTEVGVLWFGPSGGSQSELFIWDIEVDPAYRGRGFGRAALIALEPIARELGYESIGLHVFGDNDVARNLYRSSGYAETDVTMRKTLT